MELIFPELLQDILLAIHHKNGKPYLVGGIVRDSLLNKLNSSQDFDIEVYGLSEKQLEEVLAEFGSVNCVGKQFGVFKVEGLSNVDFALPRLEVKDGINHRDFNISVNPMLDYNEALKRRDLTINAILYDPFTKELIDPYNGQQDISRKVLRYINRETFIEDPLRVLRVAGFRSRLEFDIDQDLKQCCKDMVESGSLECLSQERIFDEYQKILLKSSRPSLAFSFLREIGFLPKELANMIDCYQRADFHPEGDVWNHTMLVLDEAAKVRNKTDNPIGFMFASLLHDIGKPVVSTPEGKAPNHAPVGKDIAHRFMKYLRGSHELMNYVSMAVANHMKPMQLAKDNATSKKYLKLLSEIDGIITIQDLFELSKCDVAGRGFNNEKSIEMLDNYLDKMIKKHGDKKIEPVITGKDLLMLGYQENARFKEMLAFCYDLQLDEKDKKTIIEELKRKY